MAEMRGLLTLKQRFEALGPDIARKAEREILRTALDIQSTARRRCPVKTGRLRNSVAIGGTRWEITIGTNVEYAPFVEFGTRRMRARPFLFPAFQQEAPKLEPRLIRVLQEVSGKRRRGTRR